MTDSPPPSLLVSPDQRRRLQQAYDEAVRLAAARPADYARAHELLAECLRTDPGNILYLDALLANLRRWNRAPAGSWLPSWLSGAAPRADDASPPADLLQMAPELLLDEPDNVALLCRLAEAAGSLDLDEAELCYLIEARRRAPDDAATLRRLARCLTRQGRFEEAAQSWLAVLAVDADDEARQAASDLAPAGEWADSAADAPLDPTEAVDVERLLEQARTLQTQGQLRAADACLERAQFAAGGDLRVFAQREQLRLAQSAQRVAMARARAAVDAHVKAQALVERMEREHNRLEIDILHVRSERHPGDASLRLELARRLKRAGNYSGAVQRLEEIRGDLRFAADVLVELGECWQHLRQFAKALDYYRQAVWAAERADASAGAAHHRAETLDLALRRANVLAAAMNEPADAQAVRPKRDTD